MERNNDRKDPIIAVVTSSATRPELEAVREAHATAHAMKATAEQHANAPLCSRAGRIAEDWHAGTYNMDAASKGLPARAATTPYGASADIAISSPSGQGAAQVKYCADPTRTTFKVADVKYDGMQRVVPEDQLRQVKELASKRGTDALGARNYPAVAESASDRVRFEGAESRPLSRSEALSAARNPNAAASALVQAQVTKAIAQGAVAGAVVGAGVSAISNLVDVLAGRKDAVDGALDTLGTTVKASASGAAVAGATAVTQSALTRAGAATLGAGAAPVAIAMTGVALVTDIGRTIAGDMSGDELAKRAGKHCVNGACTWGGMEGGAAIGTMIFPGVGTVVGGVLGGLFGSLFGSALTR